MDKQKIKSIPRLTTDNPVDNFQTALNFTDVSEDGWVWLRQPEMALTEYMRKLVKGHGSSIDLDCNDMELSEILTEHLFDDPKQSIDGLIAEHYTILWAYATLREKLKWYEDAGIPAIPDYGLNTIRRAINRYGTAPQLQMAIKEMSELTKAICNLQRAVTFNYRNGAKIKVAHESVREEIADVYIMLAQLVEIVGKQGSTVFPTEETDKIVDALNGMEPASDTSNEKKFDQFLQALTGVTVDAPEPGPGESLFDSVLGKVADIVSGKNSDLEAINAAYTGLPGVSTVALPASNAPVAAEAAPLNVQPNAQPAAQESTDATKEINKRVILEIVGNGSVVVSGGSGGGMSEKAVLELLTNNIKPVLMGVIKDEIFEEGQLSYDY